MHLSKDDDNLDSIATSSSAAVSFDLFKSRKEDHLDGDEDEDYLH